MSEQRWSSVGSTGTVDTSDAGKVVFSESLVQLRGFDLIFKSTPATHSALPLEQTHAVIRYGVTPVAGLLLEGAAVLLLRYRNGSGQVVAKLIEVSRRVLKPPECISIATAFHKVMRFRCRVRQATLSSILKTMRTTSN